MKTRNARCSRRPHRGVTLVEVVASTAIVGVVLSAALTTLGMAVSTQRAAASRVEAHALAESLLNEILAQPYEDPDGAPLPIGVESGEDGSPADRLSLDDVDDFDGWSRSPPEDASGAALAGFAGWTRSVSVELVGVEPDGAGRLRASGSDNGLKRVIVSVSGPSGESTLATAICSPHGAHEAAPAFDCVWVTGLAASIRAAGQPLERTASTVNEPSE
ncbi:prepilin-type N-terminal cleavage/methylation domain-containing protein [Botrimarina sp.]|uniref:prepilin-type N-terminal cleavage/methylation domain-containing protein n=1 Tax=Botrimarina sp. TaxID=2795802 RepID=UPI0032F05CE5